MGIAVSARGSAGGIATPWLENLFSLVNYHAMQHWIFTKLRHFPIKNSLALFNIYVPVNYQEKRECWTSLSEFLSVNSFSNIIVAGDLNIILDIKEKKGGVSRRDPMLHSVENIILMWDFMDFKLKKGRFTWKNNRSGLANVSSRLDRFLV